MNPVDDRVARIHAKLASLPVAENARLGPPLTEADIAAFEVNHGITLPEEYRQFLTQVGHGGYGPTYGLLTLDRWSDANSPHIDDDLLARPFPFSPDTEPPTDWVTRYGLDGIFPGAVTVVYGGCTDYTLLVVTGPSRGRLVEVNGDDCFPPRFYTDADLLTWYERWLDFVLLGHTNLNWFTEQLAGDPETLTATLLTHPSPAWRRAAACTFITYPRPGEIALNALARALGSDPDDIVREMVLRALRAQDEQGNLLVSALTDPSPKVRSLAVILLPVQTSDGLALDANHRTLLTERLAVEDDPDISATIRRTLENSS
ncbi:SMI1/KNR4 family protein [Streptosporangium sp. NPDC000396]|uniref:SMI1/KNR4 family protein n=1 Tax=Streptosporangium sp. NPDC000396 TaxID=3366185 RepID=UPI0036BA0951